MQKQKVPITNDKLYVLSVDSNKFMPGYCSELRNTVSNGEIILDGADRRDCEPVIRLPAKNRYDDQR